MSLWLLKPFINMLYDQQKPTQSIILFFFQTSCLYVWKRNRFKALSTLNPFLQFYFECYFPMKAATLPKSDRVVFLMWAYHKTKAFKSNACVWGLIMSNRTSSLWIISFNSCLFTTVFFFSNHSAELYSESLQIVNKLAPLTSSSSQVIWTWMWLPWLCQATPMRRPPCGGRCAALWGCSWRTPTSASCLPFSPVSLEPMMACWYWIS